MKIKFIDNKFTTVNLIRAFLHAPYKGGGSLHISRLNSSKTSRSIGSLNKLQYDAAFPFRVRPIIGM